ncbi:putative cytoplasmic protein, partial [Pseudomonas savastanoi pv. glycinea]
NTDQQVAAFVLPATCEPEGYRAELAKGNVRSLAPGASAEFSVTTGYLNATERRALQP